MFQGANTDLFDPLVPKAHNSKYQNIVYPVQISHKKSDKATSNWQIFIFCTLGSNGLINFA